MIVARRYIVTGRVQGVGFRFFVEAAAAREGVQGWVRNRPDGAVEAWVEGEQEAVGRMEASLHRGPGSARVEDVQVEDVTPIGRPTGFSIR